MQRKRRVGIRLLGRSFCRQVTPHVADGTRPTERGRSLGDRMSRQKYFCDLTMVECEHGGSQRFNLGFMHGTESACRHPKIDRKGEGGVP